MTVRSALYSLVIVALAFCSMGGDCTLSGRGGPGVFGRDCFTGLGTQGTIQVAIGAPTATRRYGTSYPSCAGVDGLQPGTTVTLTLSKDSRAPYCAAGGCNSYRTTSTKGLVGVTLTGQAGSVSGCDVFAYVLNPEVPATAGAFFRDPASGCSGLWEMVLAPATAPAGVTTLSPFDAGSAHPWVIWRRIAIQDEVNGPPDCGTFSQFVNVNFCEDEFVVQSITNVTP
jgi:hypothetical protein